MRRAGPVPVALPVALPAAIAAAAVAVVPVAGCGGRPAAPRAPAVQPPAARAAALGALVARRATAIRHRDEAGFLATVDAADAAFLARQRRLFTALAGLRFSTFRYDLDAPAAGRPVPAAARFAGAQEVYAPRSLVVRAALAGGDPVPGATRAAPVFLRRHGRWLLAADGETDADPAGAQREVWDYGPVRVAAGRGSLVIGHPAGGRLLPAMSRQVDTGVAAASAALAPWPGRVVAVVPGSTAEFAALTGTPPAAATARAPGMAAVTVGGVLPGGRAAGNRVVVNPAVVPGLGPLAAQVVLTHEVTHVATRALLPGPLPAWLTEGVADYVAYRSVRLPVARIAPSLARLARAGRLPTALPVQRDLTGAGAYPPAVGYEAAWLAARIVAEAVGPARLLGFLRLTARAGLPAALHRDLGLTAAQFRQRWRSYMATALASGPAR